jgi:leader peptidase (prepilin peptidase)/N-methyltransferase
MDARYWIVELLTGTFFYALWKTETPEFFVVYAIMLSGLLVASCIDIDYFIIPDRFTLGGCLAGFIASALVPELHQKSGAWQGFVESLRGAFVGGMILWVIAKVGAFVFKKEAMGLGDVKFLAGIGAFLGPWGAIFVLASSSVVGSIFGVAIMARRQKAWGLHMPYGPFLAVAAAVWIFGGSAWMRQYLEHLRLAIESFTQP